MPFDSGMLDVGDGNQVYWEEWGSSTGVPAVYLHGGPGAGLGASQYRNKFDLGRARVVGFDQRGCGRSTPHASDPSVSLATNTTSHLVRDMESLRGHLGVDAWILNGVSWGSTLALAYAQAHPDRVLGIVLFAVTTTSRREVDWVTEGVAAIFPEAWDRLASHAENAGVGYRRDQGRLVEAYRRLLETEDPAVRNEAAQEWAIWEDTHVSIGGGGFQPDPRWDDERYRYAFARLTTHYWSNNGFCASPILEQMDRLQDIPSVLIHGRRDISSPVITAWELQRRWPSSKLMVDEGDGHGGMSMVTLWRNANEQVLSLAGS